MTATMAVQAPAQEPARTRDSRRVVILAAVYYLLAALAVTLWLWRDPASRVVAGNPNDADQFAWFFRYDATAIAHLHLPALVTTAMNAPRGVNAMWNTFMLLPGVVLAPLTLLAGPQAALLVLLTAGFAGSATAMFAVLRGWGTSTGSAALGGAVYGFSPALVHAAIGHYDLQFVVLPPLIADLALRLATGRARPLWAGAMLGLLVAAQILISEEILLDTAIAVVVALATLAVSRPRTVAGRIATAARGLGAAVAVTAVVAGYPLWVQFCGPLRESGSPFTPDFFKTDLSGFVVPSSYLLFHTSGSAAEAAAYQGKLPEYLGYLGWPLLVVLVLAAIALWRRLPARMLAVTWAVLATFSLGGTLMFGGHEHHAIKLPWYWLQGLPVLSSALPDRFALVADGAAAALLALTADAAIVALSSAAVAAAPAPPAGAAIAALSSAAVAAAPAPPAGAAIAALSSAAVAAAPAPPAGAAAPADATALAALVTRLRRRLSRGVPSSVGRPARGGWLAAGWRPAALVTCCAALVTMPIVPRPLPAAAVTPLPSGWAAAFASLHLPTSASVLVVPLPLHSFTEPLRWQAGTGEPASMVGGYFLGPDAHGDAFLDGTGNTATGVYLNALWLNSGNGLPETFGAEVPASDYPESLRFTPVSAVTDSQFRTQIKAWRVSAVVAVATARSRLGRYLTAVLGRPEADGGDVMAWRVG